MGVGIQADAARDVAEVRGLAIGGVEVLSLGRPVRGEGVFEARTDRAADVHLAVRDAGREAARRRVDAELVVHPGQTAGRVEHGAVPGVADTATERTGVVDGRRGRDRDSAGREVLSAAHVSPGAVELDAENPRAAHGLPVVADLAADEAAARVQIARAGPAVTRVRTDVETGPVVDRSIGNRGLVGAARKIRRRRRRHHRQQAKAREKRTLHHTTSYEETDAKVFMGARRASA